MKEGSRIILASRNLAVFRDRLRSKRIPLFEWDSEKGVNGWSETVATGTSNQTIRFRSRMKEEQDSTRMFEGEMALLDRESGKPRRRIYAHLSIDTSEGGNWIGGGEMGMLIDDPSLYLFSRYVPSGKVRNFDGHLLADRDRLVVIENPLFYGSFKEASIPREIDFAVSSEGFYATMFRRNPDDFLGIKHFVPPSDVIFGW